MGSRQRRKDLWDRAGIDLTRIDTRKDVLEGLQAIAKEGKATFTFKCGDPKKGTNHRVVITRAGRISFPDHSETAMVLNALAETGVRRTCPEYMRALRDTSPNSLISRLNQERGWMGKVPGWIHVLKLLRDPMREVWNANETHYVSTPPDWAYTVPEISASGILEPLNELLMKAGKGPVTTVAFVDERGPECISDGTALRLEWPGGHTIYKKTGCWAEHGGHKDFIRKVRPAGGENQMVGMTICLKDAMVDSWGSASVVGPLEPTLLERIKDKRWRVVE